MAQNTPADVVIIGGGPGGYVAAIRAAQLGLVTVCVEMDKTLGGTCVNVGCIPSKALLNSSEHVEFIRRHAAEHGIGVGDVQVDIAQMLKRKDEVVLQNTKGIEFLFRKNKITWAKGRGTLRAGNLVDVAGRTAAHAWRTACLVRCFTIARVTRPLYNSPSPRCWLQKSKLSVRFLSQSKIAAPSIILQLPTERSLNSTLPSRTVIVLPPPRASTR